MGLHIVQSKEWGDFKTATGRKAVRIGNVQYTVHSVPFTNFNYAYCPKINPKDIVWDDLKKSLNENACFNIKFDVPNVIAGTEEEEEAKNILEKQEGVRKSPKSTFTQYNILLDLTQSEDTLMQNMHKKHRYNIRYAEKKGVKVREGNGDKDLNIFLKLQRDTAMRQKFLIHPDSYYSLLWETLHPKGFAHILIAEFEDKPLSAWMLFTYENVLYYPYGGSSDELQNLFASNLIGWETIRFGKKAGCETFDMWGASRDPDDENDPEWGFTNFKLKFGGKHVHYMDTYDWVLNETLYSGFNFIYPKVLGLLKKLK
jgi:peptidoglycan pentaglycine glycine transferase (the first glycine)